jgi:methylenetetrahydrofolate dehydrogenase (NADP+)/methenyltetrahydrofolate cyclohydrolase
VRNKRRAASEIGVRADLVRLPPSATLDETLREVGRLNERPDCDAILVQSPLPDGLGRAAERRVFDAIDPGKDADGFHPINVGRLVQNRPAIVACTPAGVMELLDRSGIPVAGRRAVVIGRSDIVGKPLALLFLHRDATVTICHSRTPELPSVAATADILAAAIGRPGFVDRRFVKPGAVVIDVGINRVTDPAVAATLFAPDSARWASFERSGAALVGDVHPEVEQVAGALTPVPGGVGPLTIAMLLRNTVRCAQRRAGLAD